MARALVATAYGGPEALALVDVDVPPPGDGEVTVEVRAAAVNPVDLKAYSGLFGTDPAALPIRLGAEAAGVVTAVGGTVGTVSVGDEVIVYPAPGGCTDALTVPAASVVAKPSRLGFERAAGLLVVGGAAYHLLEATGVGAGDTVLLHAASGAVGLMTAQLALERGATVLGTASAVHHERLRGLGVVPLAYGAGLADRVRAAAPAGVDVALDAAGTDEAVDVSLEVVADRHRIATVAAFDRAPAAGIQLLGDGPGADPGTRTRERGRRLLTDLAARGRLDLVVARTFPLTEAAEAHRLVGGGHAGGKVVLLP